MTDDTHSPGRLPSMAETLDVRGLRCPLPVLRARKALQGLEPGSVLTVLATDPASVIDFPHFCHQAGLDLLSTRRDGDVLVFEIRKPPASQPAPRTTSGPETA
jgi:tRNA 2-thiouridine synthesizing protein A